MQATIIVRLARAGVSSQHQSERIHDNQYNAYNAQNVSKNNPLFLLLKYG